MMPSDPLVLLAAAVACIGMVGATLAGLALREAFAIRTGDGLRRLTSTAMALVLFANLLAAAGGAALAIAWTVVPGGARG